MQLREALGQVAEIRAQLAEATVFRGYRAVTVGLSGVLGLAAAVVQAMWLPAPHENLDAYLYLWVGVAIVSVVVIVAEISWRAYRAESKLLREKTLLALEKFSPCLLAGAVLTYAIAERAVSAAELLPGIWGILFSLGIFASSRALPRPVVWCGVWYLLGGATVLLVLPSELALRPEVMAVLFGGGQILTAATLYWTLERTTDVCEGE